MKVVNLSSGTELSWCVTRADTFVSRLKGLMFTRDFPEGHGLLIQPCQSIHTFFMNFAIDVLYVSKDLEIVGMDENMKPSTMGKFHRRAEFVLELPVGTIERTDTKVGHYISITQL